MKKYTRRERVTTRASEAAERWLRAAFCRTDV